MLLVCSTSVSLLSVDPVAQNQLRHLTCVHLTCRCVQRPAKALDAPSRKKLSFTALSVNSPYSLCMHAASCTINAACVCSIMCSSFKLATPLFNGVCYGAVWLACLRDHHHDAMSAHAFLTVHVHSFAEVLEQAGLHKMHCSMQQPLPAHARCCPLWHDINKQHLSSSCQKTV